MRNIKIVIFFISTFLLSACSTLSSGLKAGPIENSEFADQALAAVAGKLPAAPEHTYPFHRAWRDEADFLPTSQAVTIYVAPVDTSLALQIQRRIDSRPTASDIEALGNFLQTQVAEEFHKLGFHIATERPVSGRIIELAIVEVSATDVGRNILGTAFSVVVPGGGLVAMRSSGSVAIEGVVRDAATNRPLFVFADRERGKTAPFSFNDFTRYSHARAAIVDWAKQLAQSVTAPQGKQIPDSLALTLLPL